MDIFSESKFTNNGYVVSISVRKSDKNEITETMSVVNKSSFDVTKDVMKRVENVLGIENVRETLPHIEDLHSTSSVDIRKYMQNKLEVVTLLINKAVNIYNARKLEKIGG